MRATNEPLPEAAQRSLAWAAKQPGWWHDSGNLNVRVLEAIAEQAARIGAQRTAETGCGLSTVVLSNMAARHTCFTISEGNSLSNVKAVELLNGDAVEFVIGPTQKTLPAFTFEEPLDLVLIDGPHGFPFAQMEYFFFYPTVRAGGVLVVDDIHIPTIRQMYDFLCDDKMWRHEGDVMTTAFFSRTDEPLFNPYGDGWELQQFNQRHFEDPQQMDTYVPGWREAMPPAPGPILGQLAQSNADVAKYQGELSRLRRELDVVTSSKSWRITAPLRKLLRLFK